VADTDGYLQPRDTMPADRTPTPDAKQPLSRRDRGQGQRPIALVVDDDALMRAMARHVLEKQGYEVGEADGGREAMETLRRGPLPDLLVTDLKMADGSGGWLVSQVGYEFPALVARTVVITGAASGAAAAHVAARWQCPVVAKPFTESDLAEAIAGLGGSGSV
jgi:CheY-like chemotaxis protein